MEKTYAYSNLRQNLRTALRQVEKGAQIVITVWGKPVATITRYKETGKEK